MYAAVIAAVSAATFAADAPFEHDWFEHARPNPSLEVRIDKQVFALFAAFNALGFDESRVARPKPIPRYAYGAARTRVRERVHLQTSAAEGAQAYFDKNPLGIEAYLDAAVGAPPRAALQGLPTVLTSLWNSWKLDDLWMDATSENRRIMESYARTLAEPLAKLQSSLGLSPASAVLLVNILDAEGEVRTLSAPPNVVVVSVGPSDVPRVQEALGAYARAYIERYVRETLAKSKEIEETDSVTATIARVLASRAAGIPADKEIGDAFSRGAPLASAVAGAVDRVRERRRPR